MDNTNPRKAVYTIVDNAKSGKAFWQKIGAAFTNRDGSLTLKLNALPVNGSMHVRDETPWEERRPDLANTSSSLPPPGNEAFA